MNRSVDAEDTPQRLVADAEAVERAVMRLTWLEHKLFTVQLDRFDLTPAQYLALVYLARAGPDCTMGQLARQMHQSSATMTGIVDRLVRRELTVRRQDPDDRRRVNVVLTDAGRLLLAEAYEAKRTRTLEILSTFTVEQRGQLVQLLETYLARAGERLGAS